MYDAQPRSDAPEPARLHEAALFWDQNAIVTATSIGAAWILSTEHGSAENRSAETGSAETGSAETGSAENPSTPPIVGVDVRTLLPDLDPFHAAPRRALSVAVTGVSLDVTVLALGPGQWLGLVRPSVAPDLARAAHDLRSPLNAVIGFSEILRDGLMGEISAAQRGCVDEVLSGAHRILARVEALAPASRPQGAPVARPVREPIAAAPEPNDDPKPHRILVVDDDHAALELMRIYLHDAGYELELVASGAEALAALETTTPSLIALDLNMPGMSGAELLQHISGNAAWAKIPVVVVSGLSSVEETLLPGTLAVVPKPVRRNELVRALRQILPPDGGRSRRPAPLARRTPRG